MQKLRDEKLNNGILALESDVDNGIEKYYLTYIKKGEDPLFVTFNLKQEAEKTFDFIKSKLKLLEEK